MASEESVSEHVPYFAHRFSSEVGGQPVSEDATSERCEHDDDRTKPPSRIRELAKDAMKVGRRATSMQKSRMQCDLKISQDHLSQVPWQDSNSTETLRHNELAQILQQRSMKNDSMIERFKANCILRVKEHACQQVSWTCQLLDSSRSYPIQDRDKLGNLMPIGGRNLLTCLPMVSAMAIVAPSQDAPDRLSSYMISNTEGTKSKLLALCHNIGTKKKHPILDVRIGPKELLYVRYKHEVMVWEATIDKSISEMQQADFEWLREKSCAKTRYTQDLCTSPHTHGTFATGHEDGVRVSSIARDDIFDFWGMRGSESDSDQFNPCAAKDAPNSLAWWHHPEVLAVASTDVFLTDLRCSTPSKLIAPKLCSHELPVFDTVSAVASLQTCVHQLALATSPGATLIFDVRMPSLPLHWWHLPRGHSDLPWNPGNLYPYLSWMEHGAADWLVVPQIGGNSALLFSREHMTSGMESDVSTRSAAFLQLEDQQGVFLGADLKHLPQINADPKCVHFFCMTSQMGFACFEIAEKSIDQLSHTSRRDRNSECDTAEPVHIDFKNDPAAACHWLQTAGDEVVVVLQVLGFAKCKAAAPGSRRSDPPRTREDVTLVAEKLKDLWRDLKQFELGGPEASQRLSKQHHALANAVDDFLPLENHDRSAASSAAPSNLESQSQAAVSSLGSCDLPLQVVAQAEAQPSVGEQAITVQVMEVLSSLRIDLPDGWVVEASADVWRDPKSISDLVQCASRVGSSSCSGNERVNGIRALTRALALKGLLRCMSSTPGAETIQLENRPSLELYGLHRPTPSTSGQSGSVLAKWKTIKAASHEWVSARDGCSADQASAHDAGRPSTTQDVQHAADAVQTPAAALMLKLQNLRLKHGAREAQPQVDTGTNVASQSSDRAHPDQALSGDGPMPTQKKRKTV